MTFDEAFTKLLGHEGGYSDHPADKGGATMWGVTEAVARANGYHGDMRQLPQNLARDIYRISYWLPVKANDLPPELRYSVFDAAVNSGVTQAIKWLQRAVRVPDDGKIGPVTLAACHALPSAVTASRYNGLRLKFMADLPNWSAFGRGWARRIAANLMEA